jgi:2-polyprenyl-3-methyl-5-hydroxy-6-metoxy-1,4-benzoquinol methylase
MTNLLAHPKLWFHQDCLEDVNCDLCGSNAANHIYQRPDSLCVVQCERCGLLYLNPRPQDQALRSLYTNDYFVNPTGLAPSSYVDYFSSEQIRDISFTARRRLAMVRRHTGLRGKRVLEIGCATGETSQAAAAAGASVVGYDFSSDALARGRTRYANFAFTAGTAQELPFRSGSCDAVVAFELIEHLPSPSRGILEMSRVLREGGLLVLTTPNAARGRQLGWDLWQGFHTSFEHLCFFDARTLSVYLSRNGLMAEGIGSVRPGNSGSWAKTALRRLGLFNFAKSAYRHFFAPLFPDWKKGDGFHALMVIAGKRSSGS